MSDVFSRPPDASEQDQEPLERRRVRISAKASPNGILQEDSVPALHPTWCAQERSWMPFIPPPTLVDSERCDLKTWRETAMIVRQDLDFLLSLSCHRFWSQMLHDEGLRAFLDQLLQSLPRPHDHAGSDEELLAAILHKTFLVFLRLSTHKESREDFFSPKAFGQLLYDHFLLDIPRIMDVCALFSTRAPRLVTKMVSNVFMQQPAYLSDLEASIQTVSSAFDSIAERSATMTRFDSDSQELFDIVVYLADVVVSVDTFLTMYPPGAKVFRKTSFETRLSHVYQEVVIQLCRYVIKQREAGFLSGEDVGVIWTRLQLSRKTSVSILRQILDVCCLQPVISYQEPQHLQARADSFLDIATSILSDELLIVDYDNLYPLSEDLNVFRQATTIELDSVRVKYLLDGVKNTRSELETKVLIAEERKFQMENSPQVVTSSEDKVHEVKEELPAVEMDSLVSQVRDLLPDLGPGFVQKCLQYFDNNPETVINSILEDNLPPHLAELDRALPKGTTVQPKSPAAASAASVRINVYDGDEFDVNCRDYVDLSRVHRGKAQKGPRSAEALLDDKSDFLTAVKDRFASLALVTEEVDVTTYDDEYDDTYDEIAVGQREPDKDELLERRPFVLPRALGGGHIQQRQDAKDLSDGEVNEEENNDKVMFVRNPEEVRAEAERRRQSKMGRGGGNRSRDVVGNPKGQGQEKQVLINRSRKGANKGKHHRAMADKKASRGMF